MTHNLKASRKLPVLILDVGNDASNPEPRAVVAKYGRDDAVISEENIDYVALGYMNPHAVLFWLPRFFDYLRTKARPDTFHLESLISHLSNSGWVSSLRREATDAEVDEVSAFLDWLGTQPIMADAPPLRATAYAYAVELWK
jgi:hypothetical protein